MPAARILIIDDDYDILEFLQVLLELEGYEIHTAASGTAGLQAATTLSPDLVLLDLSMPDISGVDVCRRLRLELGPQTPILIVSARTNPAERHQAEAAGATHFVNKPFKNRELVHLVGRFLEN